ncbi:MAG: ABC transporter ATP-binding protein [Zestosphaera sp.]
MIQEPILRMKNIVKKFPGVVAVDHVDLTLNRSEVLAILGENGAGKTTLMNVLYGLLRPDEGEIYIEGKKVSHHSPIDAIRNGIGMVHQHFTLVEDLTISENIILGLKEFGFFIDMKKITREIEEFAGKLGLKINPNVKVWQLSAGEKQKVEILKALFRNPRILILDEPTSVLTPQDTKELFKAIRKLKQNGLSIIFISHKLEEVLQIADRIVVLRRGKVVGELLRNEAEPRLLAELMVGREVLLEVKATPKAQVGEVILEIQGLEALGDRGNLALRGVSMKIKSGEILGIAGVSGNGQKELAETIYGLRKPTRGKIFFLGRDITKSSVLDRIQLGISYIPAERLKYGVVGDLPLYENAILTRIAENQIINSLPVVPPSLRPMNIKVIEKFATDLISRYSVVTPSHKTLVRNLSGGNIQRVIVGREIDRKPKLLIAEEPTAGLDIAATEFIREKLIELKNNNCSILLISSDLSELLSLSDKIAIMYNGEIVGAFKPGELDIDDIGLMMSGYKKMLRERIDLYWA